MRKSEILSALEKLQGDPEIEVHPVIVNAVHGPSGMSFPARIELTIDRINEYPRPEIVVVEKQP